MSTNIGKLFKNKKLLDTALTHRSWINENKGLSLSNERLEFLGDAVLEFIVSEKIYTDFPDREEGYLTALRANLVNTDNLAKVAENLGLGDLIKLSKGEQDSGGRTNKSLLSDTIEAIIGALFLDRGLAPTKKFIIENVFFDIDTKVSGPLKDSKSRFQELIQAKGLSTPTYKVKSETGPDHNREFVIAVMVEGKSFAKGSGKSKAQAQQAAAQEALAKLTANKNL